MKEYIITFITGEKISLTQERYESLWRAINKQLSNVPLCGYTQSEDELYVNPSHIVMMRRIQNEASTIVRPPSPDELRAEAERKEQNRDVSLNAQLEGRV